MLILGSRLIGTPIMGLHTSSMLATTKNPIIDPSNLKIVAYEVEGPLLEHRPSFLRIADIRELSEIGMIIDSSDEIVGIDDVIQLKKIYDLGFEIIGLSVIDENKNKLGKVEDFSLDTDSFIIQQLNVRPGIFKSLSSAGLLIHRSQIIEINNHSIIVKANTKKLDSIVEPKKLTYLNPFRQQSPQPETIKLQKTN